MKEELKEYVKDFKTENHFFQGFKEKTLEQKFLYIQEHFEYDVLNSWNGLKSIANNVKIYNLDLTDEQKQKYFEITEADDNFIDDYLNPLLQEFQDISNTEVFFNGQQGGYIVMIPSRRENKFKNILDLFFDNNVHYYNNLKEYKEDNIYSSNNSINEQLEECYYLLKAFDKLCDILRSEFIYILDNANIKEETETIERTYKVVDFE